ncbi:hypothetical protein B6I93_10225 [Klebsiella pneumoniae]|nr:hypothetical protein B6I93_10225 [Klebsiella pneumoniae]
MPSGFALRGLKPLQTHPRPLPAATPFLAGENASTGFLGGVSGNPRKFRHSALWNFLGGWSAA